MDDFNSLTSLNSNTEVDVPILVYPNPTNGLFYVNIGQMQPGSNYQVSIYDTKGTLILRNKFENTAVIDLRKLKINDGVYIIKIQTPTRMVAQKILYMR